MSGRSEAMPPRFVVQGLNKDMATHASARTWSPLHDCLPLPTPHPCPVHGCRLTQPPEAVHAMQALRPLTLGASS